MPYHHVHEVQPGTIEARCTARDGMTFVATCSTVQYAALLADAFHINEWCERKYQEKCLSMLNHHPSRCITDDGDIKPELETLMTEKLTRLGDNDAEWEDSSDTDNTDSE